MLQAAVDLIIEKGIDRVRLAEIARRAGMSSGQVMYYFTSKEHILLETLAWQEHRDGSRRGAILIAIPGAWKRLERYVEMYLPSGRADPAWILWSEAWARAPHDAAVSQFLDELSRPWSDDLEEIVHYGVRKGTFAPKIPPGDFTICFGALLDGLATLRMNQKPYLPRERLVELAMNTARSQLAPPEQPAGT